MPHMVHPIQKRRRPQSEATERKGLRDITRDHEEVTGIVKQFTIHPPATRRLRLQRPHCLLGRSARRLLEQKEQERQQQPRVAGPEEGGPPAVPRRDSAADDIAECRPNRDREIEDRNRIVAAVRGKQVGDPAGADRAETRLPETDEHAVEDQRSQRADVAGHQRAQAPNKHSRGHQPTPRDPITEITENRRGKKISPHERALNRAELLVAEAQLVFDRRQHRRQELTVEVIE